MLIVAADASVWTNNVKVVLESTGAFTQVDVFDAQSATPTLQQLLQYDAVLAYNSVPFSNPATLGNTLADYWDSGGRVVTAGYTGVTGFAIAGRWVSGAYTLTQAGNAVAPNETQPLQIDEPTSPLVRNVAALTQRQAYRSNGQVNGNSFVVARWGSGAPLIVRSIRNGRNLVTLNFFPPSFAVGNQFWVGDGAAIMRNALLF